MKDIPAIVQSHMAKRIALYGQEPEQPLVEELFKRYSELQSTYDQAFLDAFQKLYLFMEPLSVYASPEHFFRLEDVVRNAVIPMHIGRTVDGQPIIVR